MFSVGCSLLGEVLMMEVRRPQLVVLRSVFKGRPGVALYLFRAEGRLPKVRTDMMCDIFQHISV